MMLSAKIGTLNSSSMCLISWYQAAFVAMRRHLLWIPCSFRKWARHAQSLIGERSISKAELKLLTVRPLLLLTRKGLT